MTQTEVDGLGRPTKITDPRGNVTYQVYLDTNHEIRTYAGWQTGTSTPTDPTLVLREDRGHDPSYFEVLRMTTTPSVDGSGRPTGAESVSGVQTLSRQYVSAGGQVTREDAYFNLRCLSYSTALYIGTAGTNCYSTVYGYDTRGRQEPHAVAHGHRYAPGI